MRLILPLPEGLARRELSPEVSLITLEGTEERPAATLTLHHPRVVPMSLIEYAAEMPRGDLPPGTSFQVVSSRVQVNQVGWTMQVIHGVVTAGGAEAPVEVRLAAIFRFNPFRTFPAAAVPHRHKC